ncbi:MAG: 16S rRNA pseudouridine(516) synthase [Clostridiales bacterium]|nr:MAG: 16S rRNA pseudouridine(516) synthase [Clostridiales bacterium]
MRLDFALSNAGVGSRREIKILISRGKISVNGKEARNPAQNVEQTDNVFVLGKRIDIQRYIYLMMNKPAGYVCTTAENEKNVFELVPEDFRRKDLFCVGRLDKDTTGLLLLTNDGDFSHNIISPKKSCEKTYRVTLLHPVTDEDIYAFEEGLTLSNGEKTLPARLERTKDEKVVLVSLSEGKYHQVKRMFGACHNRVMELCRIKIGDFILPDDLDCGMCQKLPIEKGESIEKNS